MHLWAKVHYTSHSPARFKLLLQAENSAVYSELEVGSIYLWLPQWTWQFFYVSFSRQGKFRKLHCTGKQKRTCLWTSRYNKDGQERETCTFVQKCITQFTCLQELGFFCKQRTLQFLRPILLQDSRQFGGSALFLQNAFGDSFYSLVIMTEPYASHDASEIEPTEEKK